VRCAVAALVVAACTASSAGDSAAWQGTYEALNGSSVVVMVMGALSLDGPAFSGEVMYANDESMFGGLFTAASEPSDLCD
jgi:hypothetical protein